MAEIISDIQGSFRGGQDASTTPDDVAPDAYFAGINVSTKQGALSPRSGFKKHLLSFPPGGVVQQNLQINPYEDVFKNGKFQALIHYSIGTQYYLIYIVSGVIFIINQDTYSVEVIDIDDGSRLDEHQDRVRWSAAGRFLVLFDYPAFPVIVEGTTARRANPAALEVPISEQGTYNQNRLFVSNAGNEFTGGDPSGSLAAPDAPITFQEVLQPASSYYGQIFQLPTNYLNDQISAMAFLQLTDTSTGIGPLLVSTPKAIFSYQTQNPRDQWEAGQFGSILVQDNGIAGEKAFTNVNSDIFYVSNDGEVRSLSMSRDEQKKWSKVPISKEVRNWLKYWDRDLVEYASLAYFNNKIFITANPYRTRAFDTNKFSVVDYTFGGMVVIELDNISKLGQDSKPVWAGLWTGMRPMDFALNNDRLFVAAKDEVANGLWEIVPELTVDMIEGKERLITAQVYTREYMFQDPFQNKEVHSIDLALENVEGNFELDLKYKPSHGERFLHWKTFKHEAPVDICGMPLCGEIQGLSGHSFRELNLGSPEEADACDLVTLTSYSYFRRLQLKFTITGKYWELHGFKVKAIIKPQAETNAICEPFPVVKIPKECNNDWVIRTEDLCHPTPIPC